MKRDVYLLEAKIDLQMGGVAGALDRIREARRHFPNDELLKTYEQRLARGKAASRGVGWARWFLVGLAGVQSLAIGAVVVFNYSTIIVTPSSTSLWVLGASLLPAGLLLMAALLPRLKEFKLSPSDKISIAVVADSAPAQGPAPEIHVPATPLDLMRESTLIGDSRFYEI